MEGSPTIDLADSGDYKLGYCQTEYDALLSIGFDSSGAARKKYSPAKRRGKFLVLQRGFPLSGINFDSPGATGKKSPRQKGEEIFWCSSGDFP